MSAYPSVCPVCRMTVPDSRYQTEFLAITYAFCSRQCLDRFKQHPHLYIGDPHHGESVKQRGGTVLKKHKIAMAIRLSPEIVANIQRRFASLMGIKEVSFSDSAVWVTYDLLEISLADIEEAILSVVGDLEHSLVGDLKRKFIHYSQECELDNLAHPGSDGGCH